MPSLSLTKPEPESGNNSVLVIQCISALALAMPRLMHYITNTKVITRFGLGLSKAKCSIIPKR